MTTLTNKRRCDIAIINCGVGNIGSLENAIASHNVPVDVVSTPDNLQDYRRVILPGVGSFGGFMQRLQKLKLTRALSEFIEKDGKQLVGICVGMQVLFERGYEGGHHQGLGFIPGEVSRITPVNKKLRIPHVGWNSVTFNQAEFLSFNGDYYFTHSYQAFTAPDFVNGIVSYGNDITASVKNGSVLGFQFHPEKSGSLGNKLLRFICT